LSIAPIHSPFRGDLPHSDSVILEASPVSPPDAFRAQKNRPRVPSCATSCAKPQNALLLPREASISGDETNHFIDELSPHIVIYRLASRRRRGTI